MIELIKPHSQDCLNEANVSWHIIIIIIICSNLIADDDDVTLITHSLTFTPDDLMDCIQFIFVDDNIVEKEET